VLALAGGGIIASLALVVLSPLLLRGDLSFHGTDWLRLSYVGQTYGAVSALLAALALLGVAVSVLLQVREARNNRLQAERTRHYELLRMALENPSYFRVFARPEGTDDQKRLVTYTNLLLQYWLMIWEFGDLSEQELRGYIAPDLFGTDAGRAYWEQVGSARLDYAETKKARKFEEILDEEYKKVIALVAGQPDETVTPNPRRANRSSNPAAVGSVLIGIAVAGVAVRGILKSLRKRAI
jgi:hypothetical protein